MSHSAVLTRHTTEIEVDRWIEVDTRPDHQPGRVVVDAINRARAALLEGRGPVLVLEPETEPQIDELDDAAIRAFFEQAD